MRIATALLSLAALALAAPAVAQDSAPAPQDLTEQQATVLARFAMPQAFAGLQQRCSAVLGNDAYMKVDGDLLEAKLQAGSKGSWPAARPIVIKLAASGDPQTAAMLKQMSPETLQPIVGEYIAGIVNAKVKPGNCAQIDKVLSLLAPLPADNLAELVGVFVAAAESPKKQQAQSGQPAPGFGPAAGQDNGR